MYSKRYIIITVASTIIIGLIYRFYKKKKKDNNKKKNIFLNNLEDSAEDNILLEDSISEENVLLENSISEENVLLENSISEENVLLEDSIDEVLSEYSNDSIDSDYYSNWNDLLNDLIKSNVKVYDSHICKVDKNNYNPVIDMRNHNYRFWISK